MTVKVIIIGANGKMGSATVNAIAQSHDFECVAKIGRQDDLAQTLSQTQAEIAIDFTDAHAVYDNAQLIIEHKIHPVIGSSGLNEEQIEVLSARCKQFALGGIIAPNFSLGAIMMMKCSALAARYFPNVEIIESHHPQKIDAPSGTAIKTADLIAQNRPHNPDACASEESIQGARGGNYRSIPIHSLRLPGVIAKQEVVFGGAGETLSINHNSLNRESFMPGVLLACHKALELNQLVYGLENLI